jgi:fatty acid synthase
VVTENTAFHGGYMGVNSFGFGGSNTHVCLRSHPKPPLVEDDKPLNLAIPKVLCYSARTEQGVAAALDEAERRLNNPYFYKLLSDQCNQPTNLCSYRGFTIMNRSQGRPPYRDTVVSGRMRQE